MVWKRKIYHITIMLWFHQYGPVTLPQTNISWRADETYIKVPVSCCWFERKTRNQNAAKRFFKKDSRSFHAQNPRVITVDKNPAYPIAIEQLKKEKSISKGMRLRQQKYWNNIIYLEFFYFIKIGLIQLKISTWTNILQR